MAAAVFKEPHEAGLPLFCVYRLSTRAGVPSCMAGLNDDEPQVRRRDNPFHAYTHTHI